MDENSNIRPEVIGLSGLAVEFCKVLANAPQSEPQQFISDVLRYLPRIYIAICELNPFGNDVLLTDDESLNTDMIEASVTEDQYNDVRRDIASLLGEYDMYLDTPVEEMRFSDTPVAVSLAEQLADIFQNLADFAATLVSVDSMHIPDVLAELKYRFISYLSQTVCSALKAANYILQSKVLIEQ